MLSIKKYVKVIIYCLEVAALMVLIGLAVNPTTAAQEVSAHAHLVRTLEVGEADIFHPAGLAFSPRGKAFYAVEAHGQGQSLSKDTDIKKVTPFGDGKGSARIAAATDDPINMTFDSWFNRLLLYNSRSNKLIEIGEDVGGDLDLKTIVRHNAAHFGLQNPQGMTVDPASGSLYILDAATPRIVRIAPESDGTFDGATITEIDLRPAGLVGVRGLALHPTTGHLHLLSPGDKKLYELSQTGQLLATRSLAEIELSDPQGMAFAPSADLTDDPSIIDLYISYSGLPESQTAESLQGAEALGAGAAETPGDIVQVSFEAQPAAATSEFTSSLVRTVNTYGASFDPPSPDPSGLTYHPGSNKLVIVDGEVEELVNGITHFEGANVWETSLSGNILSTANISTVPPAPAPMSDEPTGITWNPNNGHYFVTQDSGRRVYDLNTGGDGRIGTSDDTWTYFSTLANGNQNEDPEGIAFDTANNTLFVADGVNREVYRYNLNGNVIGHFDVLVYGIEDPESVEFNPDSNTLYVMSSRRSAPLIVETTLTGALLRSIDISAASPRQAAGLAYAPASNGSGAKRFYIVDRMVDNDSDPNEVDGKLHEMTAPSSGSPANTAPVVNAGPNQTISLPNNAVLDGTVSDDDLPAPPATVTTTWSLVSGPGTVTFGNANAVDTTASFSTTGDYTLRLTASDSALSSLDEITVTVNPASAATFRLSLAANATVGVVAARDEDILNYDGTSFSIFFDGSDVGVGGVDVDAFYVLDIDSILMSFDKAITIAGVGTITNADIVRFDATSLGLNTAGTFSMFFDGSVVELETSGENLDAIDILPDGRLLISTSGSPIVAGVSGLKDEDILAFTPTTPGNYASGTWALYFDGSDVDLATASSEDIDGASVATNGNVYLSVRSAFAVTGVSGTGGDVFICTPSSLGSTTACTYAPTLFFDGSASGLGTINLDAFDLP